ncbi:hypothetical protein V8F20_009604 [Naviculisporaceae sp. PSN 640]
MPSPLSPIEPNITTPQRSMTSTLSPNRDIDRGCDNNNNNNSSPFMSDASPQNAQSQPRARPISRIISGGELSPLKIVQQQQTQNVAQQQTPAATAANDDTPSPAKSMPPPPLPNSPRKMMGGAPIKRFPIKVNSTPAVATANGGASANTNGNANDSPRRISLQDAIQENPGLKHAIEIFEDDEMMLDIDSNDHNKASGSNDQDTARISSDPSAINQEQSGHDDSHHTADDEPAGADDTMISTFSTFSAVPNMTMFAQMRSNSPTKFSLLGGSTPRTGRPDPSPSRTPHGNPPERSPQYDSGGSNSTVNLLDFTDQLRFGAYTQQTPSRNRHISPSRQAGATIGATPQRSGISSLLDFDIPPMPTPRSIPTITPRELESLKSNFLSEISSLKASLSGKEAEVLSLKTAVGDAEKRVGECMEHLRDLRGSHETLVTERDTWEKRGREMESVLRKVKEEIVHLQREREELEFKLDESEKRREAAEMMAQDAESKMAGMRAGKASAEAAANSGSESGIKSPTGPGASNKEVEMAVERVARELHALYKSKHEVKVAALKKSYEGRWEKKVRELQNQVEELAKENEELRVGRDTTMTKLDLARIAELEEERKREKAQDMTHIKELEAEMEKLDAMLKTVQGDNAELRVLLERERVEKGELVMLAEEMMNMQQQQSIMLAEQQQQQEEERQQREREQREREQREREQREREQREREQQEYERQQQQAQREEKRSSSGNGYYNGINSNNRPSRSSSSSSGATLNNDGGYSTAPAAAPMSLGNKTPGRRNTVAPPSRGTPLTAKRLSQQVPGAGEPTGVSNFRTSISASGRPSSLRAPGGISGLAKPTESRIGRVNAGAGHERNKSHGMMGLPRPGSGLGMHSSTGSTSSSRGIMSSIEKMGSGGRGYGRE